MEATMKRMGLLFIFIVTTVFPGLSQDIPEPSVNVNLIGLHLFQEGPIDFVWVDWTIKFQKVGASPEDDPIRFIDYKATAIKERKSVHFFIREITGYDSESGLVEHTFSVRVALAELEGMLEKK
jgi:hypothetical protein